LPKDNLLAGSAFIFLDDIIIDINYEKTELLGIQKMRQGTRRRKSS